MQEISFSYLYFVKTGQYEVGIAGVVCRIVLGFPFLQEREGGSPGLDRVEEAAGKHLSLKLRAVRAELTAGFPAGNKASRIGKLPFCSLCLWVDASPRQDFGKTFSSLKENQLKIIAPMQNKVIVTWPVLGQRLCLLSKRVLNHIQ